MPSADQLRDLDQAFDRIEETILPSLSMMLDTLLDAAALARPGHDGEVYAAELRTIALQLEELTRQIEAMSPARLDPQDYQTANILVASGAA
jgi:glyoxylase-like metal-dependent hydrolase (beta-lactamase superfamily II)